MVSSDVSLDDMKRIQVDFILRLYNDFSTASKFNGLTITALIH